MSDLEQLKKNLVYKMKAQDIGLASWKGSHGKPQKMFIPTKDYLLNSALKQQDEIQKRNEMMEEYMEEQRTPIIRVDADGIPHEYRFHAIDPPELTYDPVITNLLDNTGRPLIIDPDNFSTFLDQTNKFINNLSQNTTNETNILKQEIEDLTNDYNKLKRDLPIIKEQLALDHARDKALVATLPIAEQPARLSEVNLRFYRTRKQLDNELKSLPTEIDDRKSKIDSLRQQFYDEEKSIQEASSRIIDEQKKNEAKVKAYQEELNALNSGQLNTSKNFDETDEEYLARLQRMGDMPFADRNTQEKAYIRLKDKLRDNLKLIIRNNAVINQVVNSIYNDDKDELNEINKYFPGFKEYFIKKFGENNEKIKYEEIVNEITLYLKKARDPDVLSGRIPLPENQLVQYGYRNVPGSSPLSSIKSTPRGSRRPSYDSLSESDLILPSQQESYTSSVNQPTDEFLASLNREFEEAISGISTAAQSTEGPSFEIQLLNDDTTLMLRKGNAKIYIKMYEIPTSNPSKIIFFTSKTGAEGSFLECEGKEIYKIIERIGITKREIKEILDIQDMRKLGNPSLAVKFSNFIVNSDGTTSGLKLTTQAPQKTDEYSSGKATRELLGLGVKQSDDLPEKVQFGKNILFLKKLFLKNILSIQNKHNVKINGFNNVHVSDNFVKIIMNLINNINFNNNDLQNLSSNERLLLDNLLMLSELNKQFVTGSSTDSLNKLKKDYEILIGEIESGNNNELLKKKLYHILMKLTHFGAIGFPYAIKHYKEIIKEYF
jgi:hypothetical protein